MNNFYQIGEALKYIDNNLAQSINLEILSKKFLFSQFYFHRLFTAIVGKPLAAYIRDRRILYACIQLCNTNKLILNIALDNGFNSSQSFSRVFKDIIGITPKEYRKQGYKPIMITTEELIIKFTNRLRGGIFLNPSIIKQNKIVIAGTYGDGNKTLEVWNNFERLYNEKPLNNILSKNGYEVRLYDGEQSTVYVGYAINNYDINNVSNDYTIYEIPASTYACFDIYVSSGYDSENNAMEEWLRTNNQGYIEKVLDKNIHYCVEYYDERFNGEEANSIVEIWIPIIKNK